MSGSGETSAIPRYGVSELTQAIGSLLERGFAPRFLLDATVSRPQTKKGHLWLTLVDEQASVSAVVWASQLSKLSHQPSEGDGVTVVGKLADSKDLQASIHDEQWNDYLIVADGNHLMHFINGRMTVDVVDQQSAKAAKEGILALQIHAGPPMVVQFRDVKIKKLP